MVEIAIVNGPNLNLVGTREQDIYGNVPLDAYLETMGGKYKGVAIRTFQSNIEGELIDYLHSCRGQVQGIILNAGGYTHTSVALADAIAAIDIPVIEVHISNIYAREEYRRQSITASKCIGSITGLGLKGYDLALDYFVNRLSTETS